MIQSRPLRAAIYARYSSDLQNPSSVDDQVALCRTFIGEHFSPTDPSKALVYSDAAISGATMDRPGLARLLAAVQAGRIELLVAEGLDRLSRSLKDIATLHETLSYHGVRIWTVHEGQISELHIGLKGTMNALMLRDLKARIKRGHRARIAAGYAASSCAYGYRVVRGVVDAKGGNVNGVREINEGEAEIIRRVFREYADGRKIPEIVAGLNREEIPSPSGGLWKRNALMGGAKKQEGILRNEIYLGKLIFNRTHVVRDPTTNRKRQILNPESEWTKVDVPHLRIIDDQTWERVRLRDCRRQHAEAGAKKVAAPRILRVHNQHALTGWVKCGWCGGQKSLANESRYLCSTHRYAKKCKNSRGTKEFKLLSATFNALRSRIETGPPFRTLLLEAYGLAAARKTKLQGKKKDLEARIGRLVDAIERGVNSETITPRIMALQNEVSEIEQDLLVSLPDHLPDEETIRSRLLRALDDLKMADDVIGNRLMFQCLLERIVLTPIADQPRGEVVEIVLREEGWPEFWRLMVCTEGE